MLHDRRARRALLAGAALAATVVVGGCSALSGAESEPTPTQGQGTGQPTAAGDQNIYDVALGDCLNASEDSEVNSVPVVPCDEPHDREVYHVFELDDGEWPGAEAVRKAAEDGCFEAFEGFVGVPYEQSELYISFFTPLEDGWSDPLTQDRKVQCVIHEDGKKTTGSLENAKR